MCKQWLGFLYTELSLNSPKYHVFIQSTLCEVYTVFYFCLRCSLHPHVYVMARKIHCSGNGTLIVQLTQKGYATADPVFLRLVWRNHHSNDKVGGVTCGGQCSSAFTGLIHWTQVGMGIFEVWTLDGFQPHLEKQETDKPIWNLSDLS